jgi:hypothetical protein
LAILKAAAISLARPSPHIGPLEARKASRFHKSFSLLSNLPSNQ